MFIYNRSFDVYVRMDDSCIMINPLVTYFPSESGLSGESSLSNVIHHGCCLDFDQIVLLGLILLPTVWLVPR